MEEERAILAGVRLKKYSREVIKERFKELTSLAETAGVKVVDTLLQRQPRLDTAFYFGKGTLSRLQAKVDNVEVVIIDGVLTPIQQRNLEKTLERKVVDRRQVILDIFYQHARTKEAKLQVELAQLNYLLSRLVGYGIHLSRLGGGIGTRGPGEMKLEVDRRALSRRITHLKKKLDEVRKSRLLHRQERKRAFYQTVVLVGYTNTGKSTLMNALTQAQVPVEDKLFVTLDAIVRELVLPNKHRVLLADTVGFIRELPPQLIAAFRATLEEVTEAALILHVIDISNSWWPEQVSVCEKTLKEIGASNIPLIRVFNKLDLGIKNKALFEEKKQETPTCLISALQRKGLSELFEKISQALEKKYTLVKIAIPYSKLNIIHELHKYGVDVKEKYTFENIQVEARVPESLKKKIV